jgi:hypothetical protein
MEQQVHWDRFFSGLAASVALAAMFFCSQASAQDYLAKERGTLVAQAGSTGGVIGKTDKSISGGEPSSSVSPTRSSVPANRNSNSQESFPKTIQINEYAFGRTYTVTLRNVGGNNYDGTWSHGYVTKFAVTAFTKDSIKMQRTDNPAFGAVTGSYTGSRTGNRATGEAVISNGFTTRWEGSW